MNLLFKLGEARESQTTTTTREVNQQKVEPYELKKSEGTECTKEAVLKKGFASNMANRD